MSWFFCSSPVNALLRASFVLIHPPRLSFCYQLRATPRYVGIATSYCSRRFTSNTQRYGISGVVVTRVVAMGFHVCIVSIRRGFDSLLMYLSDLHGFFFPSFLFFSSLISDDHLGESISSKSRRDMSTRMRDIHGLSTRFLDSQSMHIVPHIFLVCICISFRLAQSQMSTKICAYGDFHA